MGVPSIRTRRRASGICGPAPRRHRQLFAFASDNAGPSKVASLRKGAKARGLYSNTWFNNVELVAAKR